MSLAEQMLATMPLSEDSSTILADEEGHIVINESRQAIVPNELKTIAVTGDKDIETITFDCVRYWDRYDLSTFAIYLNYVLPDMTTGTYIPKSITTSDGDKFYHFDWLIEKNITQKSGKISFAVTAVKTKQNENGETVVDKQWSSLPNGDCSIALGLNIENVPDNEETQNILSQMSAILEQIHADVDEWIKTALVQDVGNSEDKAMSQKATTVAIENAKSYSTSYTDEKSRQLNESIEKNNQIANRNAKQIENLKAGISEQFETDSNVAYLKEVPTNVLPYAAIKSIGGMTYKDENTGVLTDAKVSRLLSIGANVIPYPYKETTLTRSGVTFTDNGNGSITLSGTASATDSFTLWSNAESPMSVGYYSSIANGLCELRCSHADNFSSTFPIEGGTLNITRPIIRIILIVRAGQEYNGTIYPMLNRGETILPYTPYTEHSLLIPATVQAIEWYGLGISADCHNYIDLEKNQFVKQASTLVLNGTENWMKYSGSNYFFLSWADAEGVRVKSGVGLCSHFPYGDGSTTNSFFIGGSGFAFVTDDASVEDFKAFLAAQYAAGTPVTVVYGLDTPEIIDVSNIITSDNYLGVEGGGTIIFENENGYSVPSIVEYQLEV